MMEPCDDFADAATINDDDAEAAAPADPSAAAAVVTTSTAPTSPTQHVPAAKGNSNKYHVIEQLALDERHAQHNNDDTTDAVGANDNDSDSDDSDEYHDSESDVGGATSKYVVVKKSIYKEPKRSSTTGLLSRLKDASTLRSPTRSKYVVTAANDAASAGAVSPAGATTSRKQRSSKRKSDLEAAEPQITIAPHTVDESESLVVAAAISRAAAAAAALVAAEDAVDDGSDITVAIEPTAPIDLSEAQAVDMDNAGMLALTHYDDLDGVAPQVVIHSGESDSDAAGFAMLNPVIGTSAASRRTRSTVPFASTTAGSKVSTASANNSNSTSNRNSTETTPCLVSIPALSSLEASAAIARCDHKRVLVVHALSATGLTKVDKFGTQSTFLEMRVCDADARLSSSELSLPLAPGASIMRTAVHKKSGSDAQWNQTFTTPLRSPESQVLHLVVWTHNKAIVGDARVVLATVPDTGDVLDQHYTLYRRIGVTTSSTAVESDSAATIAATVSGDGVEAGRVHLQLKIIDAASLLASSAVPLAPLAIDTSSSNSGAGADTTSAVLPSVLQNGALLFKVPFHSHSLGSAPVRRQWVTVSAGNDHSAPAGLEITWCDPAARAGDRKSTRRLDLALVTEVRDGHRTKAFERQLQAVGSASVVHERDRCFSLVAKNRTLDLVASSKEEARVWVSALRELLFPSQQADDDRGVHSSSDAAALSARSVINDYRLSALSPRHRTTAACGPNDKAAPLATPSTNKAKLASWRTTFFDMARRNRTADVATCLHDGCPVDLLEPGDGDTVLMIACRLGHVSLVELCLAWRAKNDPHPEFGETALQVAVAASHASCLALLLSTAAASDMDTEIVNHMDSHNDAPLHVAARHGDLACLELLLHHGADLCVVDAFGRTPLHAAVAHGELDCVAYLLDVGGDAVLNAGDHDSDTALHYAALSGNARVVKLLLESAANVFAANALGETPYDVAMRETQQACAELIAQYYVTTMTTTEEEEEENEPREVTVEQQETRRHSDAVWTLEREHSDADCNDDANDHSSSSRSVSDSNSDASAAYASHRQQQQHLQRHRAMNDDDDSDSVHSSEYERYRASWAERERQHQYGSNRFGEIARPPPPAPPASIASSRSVLSASDQVREALLRRQTLRTTTLQQPHDHVHALNAHALHQHQQHSQPMRLPHRHSPAQGLHRSSSYGDSDSDNASGLYYSARGAASHSLSSYYAPPLHGGAFTERVDRYGHQLPQQLPHDHTAYSSNSSTIERPYTYHVDPHARYTQQQQAQRSRSHSDGRHYSSFAPSSYGSSDSDDWQQQQQQQQRWVDDDSSNSERFASHHQHTAAMRRSQSMGTGNDAPIGRTAWNEDAATQRYAPKLSISPASVLWDTCYTPDGYAYYVHRVTGASQWELPAELAAVLPPVTTTTQQATVIHNSVAAGREPALTADALIRMRLAAARSQHNSSSNATPMAAHANVQQTANATQMNGSESATHQQQQQQQQRAELPDVPLPPPAVASIPVVAEAIASTSPPPSPMAKIQSRLGFALSVDIASPTRQDETRPVFVPSPRSRSPTKKTMAESEIDTLIYNTDDGSFQRSRPSSPRSKSTTTIQIIERKRANNLALALASFKLQSVQTFTNVVAAIASMSTNTSTSNSSNVVVVITPELLACLQRFFPTDDEQQQLQAYSGAVARLGKAEQFFFLLLHVPNAHERIDMLLYKLAFARSQQSVLTQLQIVKRACRDLLENYAFLRALGDFYRSHSPRRLSTLVRDSRVFASAFLLRSGGDEKLRSFKDDLETATRVELVDVEIEFNCLVGGIRRIHAFVDRFDAAASASVTTVIDEHNVAAHGVLQLFVVESRNAIADVESEYESMGVLGDKLLDAFGESRASCQLRAIFECVVALL